MRLMRSLVPGPLRRRYLAIKRRLERLEFRLDRLERLEVSVSNLDTAVDALIFDREYRAADDVGFNGQLRRKEIFAEVVATLSPDALVETGTYTGNTSAYMAETTGLPVFSCEIERRLHAIASMRLAEVKGVHLSLSDSRAFLREMSDGPLAGKIVFFYLDAHWYADTPLSEEVEWIASHWDRFAAMIDDFQVPDDDGYGFGHYQGTNLNIDLLAGPIARHGLVAYYPAAPSLEETRRRRGCVVLTPGSVLDDVTSLRRSASSL
jgi:hypothetical protein